MASWLRRWNARVPIVAALLAASFWTGCGEERSTPPSADVEHALAAIRGIPQDGFTLGDPDAPWTLTIVSAPTSFELDDLVMQLPVIAEEFLREGRLRLQMRTPTSDDYGDDPESRDVAATLLAAGLQRRFWNALVQFVPSYTGSVDSGDLSALLRRAGVPDLDLALVDRTSARVQTALSRADAVAEKLGGNGRLLYLLASPTGRQLDFTSAARRGRLIGRLRDAIG